MGIDQPSAVDASQPRARRIIGLTGGIASGKSSVGQRLAERHGLPVLDADVYAREALAPGTAEVQAVVSHFGPRVLLQGSDADALVLDRAALGRLVFGDEAERRWLEQLVHPLVRAQLERELMRLADAPVLVLMIPLLFEAGLERLCSEIWLVDCDEAQQRERLMARNGLSATESQARIDAQWPLARKRALASLVIDNRGTPQQLADQVDAALRSGFG